MIRRRRRRSENTRPAVVIASGLATIAVLAAAGLFALRSAGGIPTRDYGVLYVDVSDSGTLRAHDPVRIAGRRIGQVLGVETNGDRSRVEVQLEPDTGALPVDTQAAIRSLGLIGARYLELIPGDEDRMLADGGSIQASPTALTYGLPEAIDTFDEPTREGVGTVVDELGTGLLGRGRDVNDVIDVGASAQRPFQSVSRAVLERPGAAEVLMPSLADGIGAVAASRGDIARSFAPAARGLAPFGDEREAVGAVLTTAPGALRETGIAVSEARRLLAATRTLAAEAQRTLPRAPAGLRAASALLRDAPADLETATPLLRDLRKTVDPTLDIVDAAGPVLPLAGSLLDDAQPLSLAIGRHACDVMNLGVVLRSMTGLGISGTNATGPGEQTGPPMHFRLALVPSTYDILGQKPPGGYGEHDPYPKPCRYTQPEAVDDPLSAKVAR